MNGIRHFHQIELKTIFIHSNLVEIGLYPPFFVIMNALRAVSRNRKNFSRISTVKNFRHSLHYQLEPIPDTNKKDPKPIQSTSKLPEVKTTPMLLSMSSVVFDSVLQECDNFTVKILCNWGNPNLTTCSSIWFLDENRITIKPARVKSIPIDIKDNLSKLSDPILLKKSKEAWSFTTKEEYQDVELTFFFPTQEMPHYLRIWNTTDGDDTSIKFIEIYHDEQMVGQGEVPMNYGVDIKLLSTQTNIPLGAFRSTSTLYRSLSTIKNIQLSDIYGKWPIDYTIKLKFTFLKNYGHKELVGLNGIDIFDETYTAIEMNDIEEILVTNCIQFNNTNLLLRHNKETTDANDMFLMKVDWKEPPTLTIVFKRPTIVSQVVFWNYNAFTVGLDAGVNHCTIHSNSKPIWTGKVRRAYGVVGSVGFATTAIWFNSIPELRTIEQRVNKFEE